MTNNISPKTLTTYTRTGGALYLYIIAAGIFAEVVVRSQLIVKGDPAGTSANILASEFLFRLGLSVELIMLVCDVALALILFVILKPVSVRLALLAAFLRIVMVGISGVNALNHLDALVWLTGPIDTGGFDANAVQALAYHSLKIHVYGYHVALVFFGFYCVLVGWLIFKSGFLPSVLGCLMGLAGLCYLVNSFASIMALGALQRLGSFILLPAFVAELSLALWLLFKSVRFDQWTAKQSLHR